MYQFMHARKIITFSTNSTEYYYHKFKATGTSLLCQYKQDNEM
jgi:hypothetical protein